MIQKIINSYIADRRKKLFWGILIALIPILAGIWPLGLLREDVSYLLKGYGRASFQEEDAPGVYYQYFKPEYRNLKSISLFFENEQEASEKAAVIVQILDGEEAVFEKRLSAKEMTFDSYMTIPTELTLHTGQTYAICVTAVPDSEGRTITAGYCSREEVFAENKAFVVVREKEQTLQDSQLLVGYAYTDAFSTKAILQVLFLALVIFLAIYSNLFANQYVRVAAGVLLMLSAPWVLGQRMELLTINTMFLLPKALFWNACIMLLLELVVFLWTLSFRWSVVLTNTVLAVLYTANYFVLKFRGVPLKLNDLRAAQTAAEVVGGYDLTPSAEITMIWCVLLVYIVLAWQCGGLFSLKKCIREKQKRMGAVYAAAFLAGSVLIVGMGRQLLYTDMLEEHGFANFAGFDQQMIYHFNGYLVSTCLDIQASRVTEPPEYSEEKVQQIIEAYQDEEYQPKAEEELPHVILIMNESFSDLRLMGNLELSSENMGFFYSLEENTVRGLVRASVLGGGTANSEFEVFTGASLGLLPSGYYGYQQGMYKERNSLVSMMDAAGYTTYSIHPESKKNWNRDSVYEKLGFDYSYWDEDFDKNAKEVHNGICDRETYYMVENLFEAREPGERMFIFDLTMQNHGGYTNSSVERTVTAENVKSDEADVYLSCIQESDEAFEELITYFSGVDEKVLICMYGDHQPEFADSSFKEGVFAQTENLSDTDRGLNQYKVPFVIWANYDIEEKTDYDISMNYLGVLLAKQAGIPLSPYFEFLSVYMQEYPIVTVHTYMDAAGAYHNWTTEQNELLDYRILQYNYMFGSDLISDMKNTK